MRVVHVIPGISPLSGGPGRSVPTLCLALTELSVDVQLALADCSALTIGLPMIRIRPIEWVTGLVHVPTKEVIYHVHALWNPFSSWAMYYLRTNAIPYVLSLRGMLCPENMSDWKKRLWCFLWEKRNVAGARAIHFTTLAEQRAAQQCGWHLPPITVIPNPVVTPKQATASYAAPPRATCRKPTIVFVGRLSKVKRLDLLLRSFSLVKRSIPTTLLIIVGPDTENIQRQLESLCENLGISDSVEFVGMKSLHDLSEIFGWSDIVTLVSQRENFGMAVAEGMASGLPAVLTRNVGVADGAEKAGAAIVVDDTPESIATAYIKLLRDHYLRRTMSVNARRFVTSEYAPQKVASQMIGVYKWVLGEGEKPDCVKVNRYGHGKPNYQRTQNSRCYKK